jgi:hypothetical protein
MDTPVMFNGRLDKRQVDAWLDLLEETSEVDYRDHSLAKLFLHLPESITFASSLEGKIIGGTSIYRDRSRLAMVLASVAIRQEFRESAAYQIIKSSLPFFKTVAIRDVDALVALEAGRRALGFPLSLELDSWTVEVIKRMGFTETDVLYHLSIIIDSEIYEKPIRWQSSCNRDDVRELIWDKSKATGLTNSCVWLAHDFASSTKRLICVYEENELAAVAGFWNLSDTLCITPIVTDSKSIDWSLLAESLITEATDRGVGRIEIPLIGKGQLALIRALENLGCRYSCRDLSLLRKKL